MMSAIAAYQQQGGRNIPISFVIYGDQAAHADFAKVLQSGSYVSANDAQIGGRVFDPDRWIVGIMRDKQANQAKFDNG
jgi:hypothetical protein